MAENREWERLDPEARRLLEMHARGQYAALLNEVDDLSKRGSLTAGMYAVAAYALTELERHGEAVNAARLSIQQDAGWAWPHHLLAAAEAARGRLNEAISAESRAVALAPAEPSYGASLARYQRLAGKAEAAVRTALQALAVDTDHVGARNELGLALQAKGDRSGALAEFRRTQAQAPGEPLPWLSEGGLLLEERNVAGARAAFHQALTRRPGVLEAEDRLADTLTPQAGFARQALHHLLWFGRLNLLGWAMIIFLYYVTFRLLQMLWKVVPALLPVAQGLLWISMAYLLGALLLGRGLRFAFRRGWPR